MKKSKFIFLLILFISLSSYVHSQTPSVKISASRPNHQSSYDKLVFKDSATNSIIKELSVNEYNPYKNYRPLNSKSADETRTIIAERVEAAFPKESSGFVGISFRYDPYDSEGFLIEKMRESTVVLLNKSGNEVFRLDNLPFDASEPLASENGKYLGFHFGSIVYGDVTEDIGFQIYDVESNSILYEVRTDDIAGSFIQGGVFIFGVPIDRHHRTYYIFNPSNQKLYYKTLNYQEQVLQNRFTREGVIYNLIGGGTRLEKYDENFKVYSND